jgi:hypothetical protein
MKKLCIGIFIFTLCFITHLSLKEKTVDYKEVDEGEVIEHVFKVLNEGDQPLQIEKVKPG